MNQQKRDQEPQNPNKGNQPDFDKDPPAEQPEPDRSTADDRGNPEQDEAIPELDNPDVEGWDN